MTTVWARRLGLRAPIVCAPMGGVAGGALASAVSRAGGLGMVGMGSAANVAALERELSLLDTGGAPFGVGFVGWGVERTPKMLELALHSKPTLVSVSFLDWESGIRPDWIAAVQQAGALAVTQVANAQQAVLAARAGVDAVVARGFEAGGHGEHLEPRLPLLQSVLAAVDIPVLTAGAVHQARQISSALDQGAAAAWVGTAFSACSEALTSDAAKATLLAADGADTVVSRVLDVALDRPWPVRFPERLLRTDFVEKWQGRELELAHDESAKELLREAVTVEDFSVVPLDAGMGVGALSVVRTAAEVIEELSCLGAG